MSANKGYNDNNFERLCTDKHLKRDILLNNFLEN